jgi:lipopolysaccharide export system permease protein
MTTLQRHYFRQMLGPLAAILGGLTLIALITQGLGSLDVIVERRQSALTFLWLTLLATPQFMALIVPLALFFAIVSAVNRLHQDNEIVVAYGAGLSRLHVAMPAIRLAVLALVANLAVNLFVQPTAYREMRQTLFAIKGDLAAAMVREGGFSSPAKNLTIYVRSITPNGDLQGLLVEDARILSRPVTYVAERGRLATVGGAPAVVMQAGSMQQLDGSKELELLAFDQYVLSLGEFASDAGELLLKPSDRYIPELFFIDKTSAWDRRNEGLLFAEGVHRFTGPLLNIPMALLAMLTVLGGPFSRQGYAQRIGIGAAVAVGIRLIDLALGPLSENAPILNIFQLILPIACTIIIARMLFRQARVFEGDKFALREA